MKMQLVMAHPDDEVIFGWPVLADRSVDSILICSNDSGNPDRKWCRHRKVALMEMTAALRIPARSLDYSSEFYRLSTRDEQLKRMMEDIAANIDPHADAVFTHNPWGEYGHMDHIIVHLAVQSTGKSIFFTDIFLPSNWMNLTHAPKKGFSVLRSADNDLSFYNYCRSFYDKHRVWTWDRPPIQRCNIITTWDQR